MASRFSRTPTMTARARRLRKNTTSAEKKLWYMLQRNQMGGLSFRRQHPIGAYVADFYCPAFRLAIEIDGGQPNRRAHRARDERRTLWLEANGITVLRFWNNDVLGNPEAVWTQIARMAETSRSRRATSTPTLFLSGGGSPADAGEIPDPAASPTFLGGER